MPPRRRSEHCELCSIRLAPTHRHLLEMATRRIVCSCDPCALRFENVLDGKFKLIPRDARPLPDFQMTDMEWEGLSLPISLAFFFYDTPNEKMAAYYPSPAGATESLLPLTAWEALVVANPVLRKHAAGRGNAARQSRAARRANISSRRSTSASSWSG